MKKMKLLLLTLGLFSGASSYAAILVTATVCWIDSYGVKQCGPACFAVSGGVVEFAHYGDCVSSAAAHVSPEELEPLTHGSCPYSTSSFETPAQIEAEVSCKAHVKRVSP